MYMYAVKELVLIYRLVFISFLSITTRSFKKYMHKRALTNFNIHLLYTKIPRSPEFSHFLTK